MPDRPILKPYPMFGGPPFRPMAMPGAAAAALPVIVYVPGSAWHRQNVWMGLGKALAAVARGFAFAVVEYRPSDLAPFPAQVEDAKSAVRFLKANAARWNLDRERFGIWGDSSGGHTAVFVGVTGDDLPNGDENPQETSPLNCLSEEKATPPFLIMHGSADNVVPFNQSVLLYEKLKALGREAAFYKLLGGGHGTGGFTSAEALQTVLDFFAEKL